MISYYGQCKCCGGAVHPIERRVSDVTRRDPSWRDQGVCDRCAEEIDVRKSREETRKWQAVSLRQKRKTERRARCVRCASKFWFQRGGKWPTHCPKCAARFRVCRTCHAGFETDNKTGEFCSVRCRCKWEANIWWMEQPRILGETEFGKLPFPEVSRRVIEWDPEGDPDNPGLFVYGPTGVGKTRSVMLLLRRAIESGFEVRFMRSSEFAREFISRAKPGGGGADEWLDELRNVEVLCLDEVEKLKFTERVLVEFFDLIDRRLHGGWSTIFISNTSPEGIAENIREAGGENYAAPFLRRIHDFCLPVNFQAPKRTKAKR